MREEKEYSADCGEIEGEDEEMGVTKKPEEQRGIRVNSKEVIKKTGELTIPGGKKEQYI